MKIKVHENEIKDRIVTAYFDNLSMLPQELLSKEIQPKILDLILKQEYTEEINACLKEYIDDKDFVCQIFNYHIGMHIECWLGNCSCSSYDIHEVIGKYISYEDPYYIFEEN